MASMQMNKSDLKLNSITSKAAQRLEPARLTKAVGEQYKSTTSSTLQVTQRQSLDIAQTLLHGSISCLAYLRNLFPEPCFDDYVYRTTHSHHSYEDYARGGSGPLFPSSERGLDDENEPRGQMHGTTIKVMRRGRSHAVDTFLDWLERGAFEALRLNILRAIQLNILEDPNNPSNVVETYTFSFRYVQSANNATMLSAIDVRAPSGETVTVKTARHALQMFIRRLIALCSTLPDLPENRFLTMYLCYVEGCDPSYEPPGFEPCRDSSIYFPNSDGWVKQTQGCGNMNTGFHSVSLKVSHLHYATSEANLEKDSESPLVIPSGRLQYTEVSSLDHDMESLSSDFQTLPIPGKVNKVEAEGQNLDMAPLIQESVSDSIGGPQQASLNSDVSLIENSLEGWAQSLPLMVNKAREINPSTEYSRIEPKEVGAGSYSNNLRSLTSNKASHAVSSEKEEDSQGTTQIEDRLLQKRLVQILEPSTQDQSLEATQRMESLASVPGNHGIDIPETPAVCLSQKTIAQLQEKGKVRKSAAPEEFDLEGSTDSFAEKMAHEDTINCQCSWDQEEDDMIQCSFCETWQHLYCYGYRGLQDKRIPSLHACYECLLGDKEAPLLRELKDLALIRKGLRLIEVDGLHSDKAFSESLHCDLQTASRLAKHLRKQGYLVPTAGSKKRGFNLTGKPRYTIVTSERAYLDMMKKYFDPTAKIAHHLVFPEQPLPDTLLTNQHKEVLAEIDHNKHSLTLPSHRERELLVKSCLGVESPSKHTFGQNLIRATPDLGPKQDRQAPSQNSRYPIRHSRNDTKANKPMSHYQFEHENLLAATPLKKRQLDGRPGNISSGNRSSKRLKRSKSRTHINVGTTATP